MFVFDPYSPEMDSNPFPAYETLREQYPCMWSEQARMWILSRYDDIANAVQDWQTYSSAKGNMMDELPGRTFEGSVTRFSQSLDEATKTMGRSESRIPG